MQQTLFLIPHQIGPLPVFGFGWALILLVVVSVAWMAYVARRHGAGDALSYLPVLLMFAAAVAFVAPMMEMRAPPAGAPPGTPPQTIGLPIRGYGVMMLLGVVASVGISAYRAKRMGLEPEVIFSLAFVMFLCGIVGARLFFVIEYWEQYAANPLQVFNVTQGGLVVYGSVLGGVPAGIYYLWRNKLPVLAVGDIIAPGMVIGLAFGRIGCLMNGCCFGGVCDVAWAPHMTFPKHTRYAVADSPPYSHQHELGQIYGVRIGSDKEGRAVVQAVYDNAPESVRKTLKPGDRLRAVQLDPRDLVHVADNFPLLVGAKLRVVKRDREAVEVPIRAAPKSEEEGGGQVGFDLDRKYGTRVTRLTVGGPADSTGKLHMDDAVQSVSLPPLDELARETKEKVAPAVMAHALLSWAGPHVELETEDGRVATLALDELPRRSLPVHPTQIYSSVNAFLLCLFLWVLYPFRRRDGEVFAAMLLLYPIARFLLEMIRNDEPAQFGTGLTIAQLVSLVIFAAGAVMMVLLLRRPRGSALPPAAVGPAAE